MELVSVIIPLYNYSMFIGECLDSVSRQTYKELEIIVVDDCSTDNGPEIVEQRAKKDPRIQLLVLDKNEGYSHAKNVGLRFSSGAYVTFLDADDMFTDDSVEVRLRYFKDHPEMDLVHALAWRLDKGEVNGYNKQAKIHAQTVMARKEVFEKYGLFYEQLRSKSDKEMWYRLGIHPKSKLPRLAKSKKIRFFAAYYRKHVFEDDGAPTQMHKYRRENPDYNTVVMRTFKDRIIQLREEGITRENTAFL